MDQAPSPEHELELFMQWMSEYAEFGYQEELSEQLFEQLEQWGRAQHPVWSGAKDQ